MLNTKDGKLQRGDGGALGEGPTGFMKSKGIMKSTLQVLLFFLYYVPNPNKLEKSMCAKENLKPFCESHPRFYISPVLSLIHI